MRESRQSLNRCIGWRNKSAHVKVKELPRASPLVSGSCPQLAFGRDTADRDASFFSFFLSSQQRVPIVADVQIWIIQQQKVLVLTVMKRRSCIGAHSGSAIWCIHAGSKPIPWCAVAWRFACLLPDDECIDATKPATPTNKHTKLSRAPNDLGTASASMAKTCMEVRWRVLVVAKMLGG